MEKTSYNLKSILKVFKEAKRENFETQESFRDFLFKKGFHQTNFGYRIHIEESGRTFDYVVPVRQNKENPYGLCLLTKTEETGIFFQNYIPVIVPQMLRFPGIGNKPEDKLLYLKENSMYRRQTWSMAEKILKPLINYSSSANSETMKDLKFSLGYVASFYNQDELNIKSKINEAWNLPAYMPLYFGFVISDYLALTEVSQIVATIITNYRAPSELTLQKHIFEKILIKENIESNEKNLIAKESESVIKHYFGEVLKHPDLLMIGEMIAFPIGNNNHCGSTMSLLCGIGFRSLGICRFHDMNFMTFVFLATFFTSPDFSIFKHIFLNGLKIEYPTQIRNQGYSQSTYEILEDFGNTGKNLFEKVLGDFPNSPLEKMALDLVPGEKNNYEEWM